MEFHRTLDLDDDTSAAFWAAYLTLTDRGVNLAEVRRDVAREVVTALLERRRAHGMGHMLFLAQCDREDRQHVVNQIHAALPDTYTSVTRAVVDAALVAAAEKLAEG